VWLLQDVQSGSMEPTFPQGSMLVVEPIHASQVQVGMAVVFVDPADPARFVTHRVVEVSSNGSLQFWTQGDANMTRDPLPVPARSIRGRVRSAVSGLGFIAGWLQWPRSFVVFVALPGLWLSVSEWRRWRSPRRRRNAVTAASTDN
jgi:signal peptidase I